MTSTRAPRHESTSSLIDITFRAQTTTDQSAGPPEGTSSMKENSQTEDQQPKAERKEQLHDAKQQQQQKVMFQAYTHGGDPLRLRSTTTT